MSYEDVAKLSTDSDFTLRLAAGLTGEAVLKVGDTLADLTLKNPALSASMFMPLVSSSPGFGDKYATGGQAAVTDGDILSAIQTAWPRVADLYHSTLNPV